MLKVLFKEITIIAIGLILYISCATDYLKVKITNYYICFYSNEWEQLFQKAG